MRVIYKPIISEKSMNETATGKYIFKVAPKANKQQIAKAIEEMYKVAVLKVNSIKVKPEERLVRGRFKSKTKLWKKAIVTIKKGQKIEGFEIKE